MQYKSMIKLIALYIVLMAITSAPLSLINIDRGIKLLLLTYVNLFIFQIIYFIPSLVAALMKRHAFGSIAVLNILTGWTIIGWVVLLVWALYKPQTRSVKVEYRIADEIEQLARLKEKDILTEEEYNRRKELLLSR